MFKQIKYIILILIAGMSIISMGGCDASEEASDTSVIAVAVGEANTILTSHNGTDWTERDVSAISSSTINLYAVAYGKDDYGTPIWMAGGDLNTGEKAVLTSRNGVDWEKLDIDITKIVPGSVKDISYPISKINAISYYESNSGVQHWVLVGDKNGSNGFILKTNDLKNWIYWDNLNGVFPILNDVANDGNNKWVAVGNGGTILTSDGLASWTDKTDTTTITAEHLNGVDYGNGTWFIAGDNDTTITGTISSWGTPNSNTTGRGINNTTILLKDISCISDTRCLAVGKEGISAGITIIYENQSWSNENPKQGEDWNGLAYDSNNKSWTVVGKGIKRIALTGDHIGKKSFTSSILHDIAFKE